MVQKLTFVHLIGEGIGEDYAIALEILMKSITTIEFNRIAINEFRLPNKELDPSVTEILKKVALGIKGPTGTEEGKGAKSINVALRQQLGLFANIRPVSWFPGVRAPVTNPELLDVVIFRENTEDVYMGIEYPPGSYEARNLLHFLHAQCGVPSEFLPNDMETGVGLKLISKLATEKIMHHALDFAIMKNRKRIGIAHKGNIMKYTEGAFLSWATAYAKLHFRSNVYCFDEVEHFTDEEKAERIFIDKVTADDAFAQLLIKPERFDVIITTNLNGDYISDAAAAQVGGVPVAACANIGNTCALFEAVGGTANNIAGQNKANPTGFFLAFAMMLRHASFFAEADAIEDSIKNLFSIRIGTNDMEFEKPHSSLHVSMSDFATRVADKVANLLL